MTLVTVGSPTLCFLKYTLGRTWTYNLWFWRPLFYQLNYQCNQADDENRTRIWSLEATFLTFRTHPRDMRIKRIELLFDRWKRSVLTTRRNSRFLGILKRFFQTPNLNPRFLTKGWVRRSSDIIKWSVLSPICNNHVSI